MSVSHNDSGAVSLPSYRKNSVPLSVDISTVSCRNYIFTYIISGEATLTMPMEQLRFSAGEMLFLERGDYCIERHSHGRGVYRDITVEFGESELVNALSVIGRNGSLERAAHRCPRCDRHTALTTSGARLSLYFDMLALYMDGRFDFDNYTFRLLKLSELFCILMSLEDHVCIGGRLLRGVSDGSSIIDKTVKQKILRNSSIKDMSPKIGIPMPLRHLSTSLDSRTKAVACPIPVALYNRQYSPNIGTVPFQQSVTLYQTIQEVLRRNTQGIQNKSVEIDRRLRL